MWMMVRIKCADCGCYPDDCKKSESPQSCPVVVCKNDVVIPVEICYFFSKNGKAFS